MLLVRGLDVGSGKGVGAKLVAEDPRRDNFRKIG